MLIWDHLTIEQYKKILKGESLNLKINISQSELIDQLSNPIIEDVEVELNTYEYIQLKQLKKIENQDMVDHFEALGLKGIKAKDALNIVNSKIKKLHKLDEDYIELFLSEDTGEPEFTSDFLDRFTWLVLISEIYKEFGLNINEIYKSPAEDFLQFSLYLKGKREYEAQKMKQYKNR